MAHPYNESYSEEHLNYTAFPMGGIGAGMICLDGTGSFSHLSIHHKPQIFNEPYMFAALSVQKPEGRTVRVLAGPTPDWKIFFPWGTGLDSAGNGGQFNKTYGLPHFRNASFQARFPFGTVRLEDAAIPVQVELTGWSPFIPGRPDDSSLPVAGLEYVFSNPTDKPVEFVFSFHSKNNFLYRESGGSFIRKIGGGFVFTQPSSPARPHDQADFAAHCTHPDTKVNPAWFRSGWFDAQTTVWKTVEAGAVIDAEPHPKEDPGSGASLYVPVTLAPGASTTLCLQLSWHVPFSDLRWEGKAYSSSCECAPDPQEFHQPWYAGEYADIDALRTYWSDNYDSLKSESREFTAALYDTSLPAEMVEAVAANLTILKSPTILRQKDGRLWAYEGCSDNEGCCAGSCTHVWNYAQALAHLFPDLERGMRETEFGPSQDDNGHQTFRSALPIDTQNENCRKVHAAADGQLGGIMKVYREWRISGDTEWLKQMWPQVKQSLHYCIETWDPDHRGILVEPHHNTYDIEFWGPDGMCCSFYLGALKAAALMAPVCGGKAEQYEDLYSRGRAFVETELWNGEYFIQKTIWEGLRAPDPTKLTGTYFSGYSQEATELLQKEGPKYQYGIGCLSDGVMGAWMAAMCGLPSILDPQKVKSHLIAVFKYNFRETLWDHANPQRPGFALDDDGGLLLCTWPRGDALSIPFPYSNEVWTGIEYQVASHLLLLGEKEAAQTIVKAARTRYNGIRRNPFNEYECGSWYARALSSYGLLQGVSGARYDAVEKVLYLKPTASGDCRCFLATATGYGIAGVKNGKPFFEQRNGNVEINEIKLLS